MPRNYDIAKRAFDVVAASLAMVVLAPLMLVVAVAVLAFLGRPVLFRQLRPGLGGRPFTVLKFRTMREARDPEGESLADSERLGRFGRMLRASSLDELPELWNVFRGDMSFVGPRPLLMEYLPLYSPQQARRHEVRPGITGWAQINGRNAVSWTEKFELDVWYVDHRSLSLDLEILAKTVWKVLRGEGIAASGEATMSRFNNAGDPSGVER